MKKIYLIFVLFTFFGCNDDSNLGNDYFYLADYEAIDIGYAYGNMIYKSENENHFNNIIVYSDIKNLKYDDKYVIVLQEPNKGCIIKRLVDDLTTWNNYYLENKRDSMVDIVHNRVSLKRIHNLIDKNKKNLIKLGIVFLKMINILKNYFRIKKIIL